MKGKCGETQRGCKNCGLGYGRKLHGKSVRAEDEEAAEKGLLAIFAEGPGLKPFA